MNNTDPFYLSPRWRRLRKAILRRDGYLCQISKRYGRTVEADTVHHIFPREAHPELQWSPWNLIAVSSEAHKRLHDPLTGELTEEGRRLQERARATKLKASPPGSEGQN